ncbi:hemerythrin family protein [Christensenellaceae bacterium OttesenSCG-928-K19]|nr:hemerythrin family protein [Christensenellaceae bacterium OttesenSCG-928-K19]
MVIWDDLFKTGVEEMDAQHKEIFRRLEKLRDQKDTARIPSLVEYFGKYLLMHLDEEQKLHQTTGYPKWGMHKSYHRYYAAQFETLKKKILKGGELAQAGKLIDKFIDEWFVQHIIIHDMEFAYFYKYGADEAGITPAYVNKAADNIAAEAAAKTREEQLEEALENRPNEIQRKTARFSNLK